MSSSLNLPLHGEDSTPPIDMYHETKSGPKTYKEDIYRHETYLQPQYILLLKFELVSGK